MRIIISLLLVALSSFSLTGQNVKENSTIVHEVKAKETLYSLSRTYDVPISRIIELNPGVDEGLGIGQRLNIPKLTNTSKEAAVVKTHIVKAQETLYSVAKLYNVTIEELAKWNNKKDYALSIGEALLINANVEMKNDNLKPVLNSVGKKIHVVKAKETLYSISRLYAVTSEDLMGWNRLKANDLSIGQELIVGVEVIDTNREKIDSTEQIIVTDKVAVVNEETEIQNKEPEAIEVFEDDKPRKVKNVNGFEEIVQTGLAELIDGTGESRKYLALHSSARVGTIMKVRNEMNNQMVFVRVIGTIPNTGDNGKILIKLSKAAYNRLGALDKRFRVEVSYMP